MNIIEEVRRCSELFADLPAILDRDRQETHRELWSRVDRLSQAFVSIGLRKGERLIAWLPNCIEAIECELACLQSGAVWITLHQQMTWREVAGVIRSTEPALIVAHSEIWAKTDRRELAAICSAPVILVEDDEGGLAYERLIAEHDAIPPGVHVEEDDVARLRYTSGTAGKMKAAVLTHRVYLASLELQQSVLHPMDTSDRTLHAAPLTHASGALIYPTLAAGGANVVLPKFLPEEALETVERLRITTMFVVPTILQRLADAPGFHTWDLSSLRTVTYGGAPIAAERLRPVFERLPNVLVQIYGLTEAVHPVTSLGREEHYAGNPRLASAGKPTHINEVRIADESGGEAAEGAVGEILVRGPNVMTEYWRDPQETAAVLRDGWLATGDLAYRDADGHIYIVDRKKDVVISGGFNVYTSEVELALCEHPDVAEAVVIGIPHEDWGEQVHAIIVPRGAGALSEAAIIGYCRERLSPYKVPKSVEFRSEPLPKTGAAKIAKGELRRRFWPESDRQVH
ncbi:MAG: AMP-binding protein [Candidatus Hydrogenedentota bacterium]